MLDRIIRQIFNRFLTKGINKGIDLGIDRMAGGKYGAKSSGAKTAESAEADKLQQQRSREMAKRVKDMAKLTRRMR